MKTILITGFDPFGGEAINPAWEAVKLMDGFTVDEYVVAARMIPTVRYKSLDIIKGSVEELNPEWILCVG